MSIKQQGFELNRALNVLIAPADIGAFNRAVISIVLKGDASRRIRITGFEFDYRVGVATDVSPNSFLEVAMIETSQITGESTQAFFYSDFGAGVRFHYGTPATTFQSILTDQFTADFKLLEGITYTFVATYTGGVVPNTGIGTAFLTLFGYEEPENQSSTYYAKPR